MNRTERAKKRRSRRYQGLIKESRGLTISDYGRTPMEELTSLRELSGDEKRIRREMVAEKLRKGSGRA